MNFLAHIYLSGKSEKLRIGNFIGDWVKGSKHKNYDAEIQKGILLHRKIDEFTDNHEIVKISAKKFAPVYNRYSTVVCDIVYDHFLAINWKKYCNEELSNFSQNFYKHLQKNKEILPERVQKFLPALIENKRLESYETLSGIEDVLYKMSIYTSLPEKSKQGISIIKANYVSLNNEFNIFFPKIIKFVNNLNIKM